MLGYATVCIKSEKEKGEKELVINVRVLELFVKKNRGRIEHPFPKKDNRRMGKNFTNEGEEGRIGLYREHLCKFATKECGKRGKTITF